MPGGFTYDSVLSQQFEGQGGGVRELAERLNAMGSGLWFDEWVLKAGETSPRRLRKGWSTRACWSSHVGQRIRLGLVAVGGRHIPLPRPDEQGAPLHPLRLEAPH